MNNSVTTSKIADDAVTGDKIAQQGATNDQVVKWNGATWAPAADATGGSPWAGDTNGIFYSNNVGINTNSSADFDLFIEGDLRVTQDVVLGSGSANPVRIEDNIEIGGNLTFDSLSSDIGTTIVVDANGRLRKMSSSLRYKGDVADLPSTGNAVLALRPVSFEWNSTGEPDIGLIAEEVAEVIPDLVLYNAEGRPDGVKYDRLGVYLLQVVKSQRGQIAAQEQRLERIERELAALKAKTRRH